MKYLYLLISILTCSCGMYSFSGASISPGAKTFSVEYFKNNAPSIQPTLSNLLTESLKDKITGETNLTLSNNGELQFQGEITDYRVSPIAIQANETAAQNRLTITIKAKFINKIEESNNYSTSFSHYIDFDSTEELALIENELNDELVEIMCDKIFNKAFSNW